MIEMLRDVFAVEATRQSNGRCLVRWAPDFPWCCVRRRRCRAQRRSRRTSSGLRRRLGDCLPFRCTWCLLALKCPELPCTSVGPVPASTAGNIALRRRLIAPTIDGLVGAKTFG